MSPAGNVIALAAAAWALLLAAISLTSLAAPWLWASWLVLAAYLLLLAPGVLAALERWGGGDRVRFGVPLSIALIGIAAAGFAGDVGWWRMAAFPLATGAVVLAAGRGAEEPGGLRLILVALALGLMAGVWDRALRLPLPGDLRAGYAFFAAAAISILLFRVVRPLRSFDVTLALSRRDLLAAGTGVVALFAVAMPFGLLADFVTWAPRGDSPGKALERFAALVLFVALPEELLFRGMIQEGLTRLRGKVAGLLIAAVVFGLVHAPRSTGLLPDQINALGFNWRLAVMAALAGVAYGWVYQRTGKLAAAALTHGATNWLWGSYFLR